MLIFMLMLALNLLMQSMIKWFNTQSGGTVISENAISDAQTGKK